MGRLTCDSVFCTAPFNNTIQDLGVDVIGAAGVSVTAGAYITATVLGAVSWTFTVAGATEALSSMEWTAQITGGTTTQTFSVSIDGGASTPVKWASGTAPSLGSGTTILRFIKGGGSFVLGYVIASNIS